MEKRSNRLVVVALIALMPVSVIGQTPTGVIEGTVKDSTGAVLASATVTARNADTNQGRTVIADSAGTFRLTQLPVGTYRIQVAYPAFNDSVQDGVVLTIGQTVHLTIALVPAGVAETVGVSAQPTPLDTRQTAATTTVDNERIEELPVQSRDYLHFVLLAPGVVSSPSASVSATAAALPDSGFSFAGLRPRSNMLTIDGLDNNDRYSGTSRTELSLETVREFQVVNSGWAAEHGGAAGGAINVVTKSGANTTHGDAFTFGELGALNAPPPLEETLGVKPSLTRFRAGFALGGPIVKDRTFYYGAIEREQSDGQAASDVDPQLVSTINARLGSAAFPKFDTRLTSGLFPTALRETEWSAKVNHQVTPRDSLMIRVAGTNRSESADAFNTGGLTDQSARGSNSTRDTALTAAWTAILGSRVTNDVRGQLATRSIDTSTSDGRGPGMLIAGVAEAGRPYASNDTHDQTYAEIGDTVGWSLASHFVKAGFDFTNLNVSGTRTDGQGGIFQFRRLDAFLAGQPDSFRQVFGMSAVDISSNHIGIFVQDQWTPIPRFTLDAGVRFDADRLPGVLSVADRQFGPRIGIAWTPADKWLVRGGIGRFADRLVLAAFEPALLVDGQHGLEQTLTGSAAATVLTMANGGALSHPLAGVAPSIYSVRPGMWQPSSRQMSIGAERALTSNLTASINYLFAQGRNLPRTVNVNLPPPTVLTLPNAASLGIEAPVPQQLARPVFGTARINPAFDAIFQLQPTATSTYHGVTMMLNRRLANELEWSAAYTWSHATDTASDFDEQPENPYSLNTEAANSRYDQRHRFVMSALFDLPIGEEEDRQPGDVLGFWTSVFRNIQIAPIFTLDSGRPVDPITGADDSRTGAYPLNARPFGLARNSLRLPASATLDLRVLKFFNVKPHGKLDIVVEAFNVLNRVNIIQLNSVYGPLTMPLPAFGAAVDATAMRRLQFSLDFEF